MGGAAPAAAGTVAAPPTAEAVHAAAPAVAEAGLRCLGRLLPPRLMHDCRLRLLLRQRRAPVPGDGKWKRHFICIYIYICICIYFVGAPEPSDGPGTQMGLPPKHIREGGQDATVRHSWGNVFVS